MYRSSDMINWTRQGLILDVPGEDPMDRCFVRHADVVVLEQGLGDLAEMGGYASVNEAALFYFTHPEWDEAAKDVPQTGAERRTVIHVARLWVEDGVLKADRNIDGVHLY